MYVMSLKKKYPLQHTDFLGPYEDKVYVSFRSKRSPPPPPPPEARIFPQTPNPGYLALVMVHYGLSTSTIQSLSMNAIRKVSVSESMATRLPISVMKYLCNNLSLENSSDRLVV